MFAPGPHGNHDVAAGAQVAGGDGEYAGEPGEQPEMADVGQVPAVEHLHSSPMVANEPGCLHRLCRERHGLPLGAQDMREKFVRIRE